MLFSANQAAAYVDKDFILHKEGHIALDVRNAPNQKVKPLLFQQAKDARFQWAKTVRTDLQVIGQLGNKVFQKAIAKSTQVYQNGRRLRRQTRTTLPSV